MKREYIEQVHCGNANIEILLEEKVFRVNIEMEKFGECTAYKFISDQITKELNSAESKVEFAKLLQSYECIKQGQGCIQAIGRCLEDFLVFNH